MLDQSSAVSSSTSASASPAPSVTRPTTYFLPARYLIRLPDQSGSPDFFFSILLRRSAVTARRRFQRQGLLAGQGRRGRLGPLTLAHLPRPGNMPVGSGCRRPFD